MKTATHLIFLVTLVFKHLQLFVTYLINNILIYISGILHMSIS